MGSTIQVVAEVKSSRQSSDVRHVHSQICKAQGGSESAQNRVLEIVNPYKNRLVMNLGAHYNLSQVDIEDAQQEGVFWVIEAIGRFKPVHCKGRKDATFITFLHRVITFRFRDFVRSCHRSRTRELLVFSLVSGGKAPVQGLRDGLYEGTVSDHGSEDPSRLIENRESRERLSAVISKLDKDSQRLWHLLRSESRLGEIAKRCGVSYEAVRHRRRKLVIRIRAFLYEGSSSIPR